MSEPVSIVLVAVGGYGNTYVNALLDSPDKELFRIEGVVDPYADRCRRLDELKALGIPFFNTLEQFYAKHTAQLAVISSPIHLHCPQTCEALRHGTSVLCEKPLGSTIQEAHRMIEERDRAGCFVAIGYQWSFSDAVQALKRDILSGRFGRPVRLKTLVLWPRTEAYYGRNTWAGALDDGAGNWILDSPVNNATAHYLHNMLYVAGPAVDRSIAPARLTAELYRANPITNYDTGAARIVSDTGVEMLYIASHAVETTRGPEFLFEFERGTVRFGGDIAGMQGEFADGQSVAYGDPGAARVCKLWDAIAAVRGEKTIVCGPEAAGAQTLVMNGMQESAPSIVEFPERLIAQTGEPEKRVTCVQGLSDVLGQCYAEFKLPSEVHAEWATAGREIDLTTYKHFPGG